MAKQLDDLVHKLGELLLGGGQSIVTAESCTGGLVAAAITDVPGSSQWFHQGYVTYSNEAKQTLLGVDQALLAQYGAVSEQVVREMLMGALAHSQARYGLSVSGIAGPGGGTNDKPVGTVWIAWGAKDSLKSEKYMFNGSRKAIRQQAVCQALENIIAHLT